MVESKFRNRNNQIDVFFLRIFKIGTIDKDHLNLTMKNLSENTAYVFKIHNQNSPDEENNIIQQFQFETASGLKVNRQ